MTTCWGWKAPICSEHSHVEQVTQDHAQSGFEYLQRRRFCNFSGQPAPVFNPLYTKGVFLYFTCNLMYFKLCLLPRVLMLCTTKEWYSVFFAPPVKYWYTLLRLIWVFSSMKSKSFFRLPVCWMLQDVVIFMAGLATTQRTTAIFPAVGQQNVRPWTHMYAKY